MQGILGTSLNHPIFTVTSNPVKNEYNIFLGFENIFNIPGNKDSLMYKSAIAMLLCAGIKIKHIEENFNITFKTIKKIDEAFKGEPKDNELLARLRNPGRENYKINDEIHDFIIERVNFNKGENIRSYNVQTTYDVKQKFGITIHVETVRNEYKKEKDQKFENRVKENVQDEDNKNDHEEERKNRIEEITTNVKRNAYAGALLLTESIKKMIDGIACVNKTIRELIVIWIFGIIAGAKNLERFRYLHQPDLQFICNVKSIPSVESMRNELFALSINDDTKLSSHFLKKTIEEYAVLGGNEFYIDGHYVEYSGKEKILEGWNTKKNRVTKGYVLYYVHDSAGNPIFSEVLDNYYDFREVISLCNQKLKKIVGNEKYTLIYDRGGFSLELMKEITETGANFITWEKGFNTKEVRKEMSNEAAIQFPYNEVGTFRSYNIRYTETRYVRDDCEYRKIIIMREGADEKKIYQAILTSDEEEKASEIIRKILNRFLQENDFKKQKQHFGIDEITSYRVLDYNELNDKVDKEVIAKEFKNKLEEIFIIKKKRKELFQSLGIRCLKDLTKRKSRSEKTEELIKQITDMNERIKVLKGEAKDIKKTISKIEKCRREKKVEMDLRPKRLLDIIKIAVRNIVNNCSLDFLSVYKNLRDYQKVFRTLSRIGGEIEIESDIMRVKLDRFGREKFQKKCEEFFHHINDKAMKTLDGRFILHFEWLN